MKIFFLCTAAVMLSFAWVCACMPEAKRVSVSYDSLRIQIGQEQTRFRERYQELGERGKDSLVLVAQTYLFNTITEQLIPSWHNTPWEFYGTTEVPRKGSIACGYFVTTVLKHAGFDIPRVAWAQLASETMMKKLNPDLKRFRNAPIDSVESYFKRAPQGLYLVGLDNHVGFVLKKGGRMSFIHSSYYHPDIGVMEEELRGGNPLNDSFYRVFGRILHEEMVRNWILGVKYN